MNEISMKCQMCQINLKKIIAAYYDDSNHFYVCDRCYGPLEEFVRQRRERGIVPKELTLNNR